MKTIENIWQIVLRETTVGKYSTHGPKHWVRVERNGIYIAEKVGADKTVISLFAVFHDCMRRNDGWDPGHGLRGAEFAKSIRNELDFLTDEQFDKLYYACQWHTEKKHTDDLTVGTCWDADRLDLRRVWKRPKSRLLNTKPAKEIAQNGDFRILEEIEVRNLTGWN
jgi:uncharacterized protein